MSEEPARYHACPSSILVSPARLLSRKSLRDIQDNLYRPPTTNEIRSVFNIFGQPQQSIADLLGVSIKTLERWLVDSEKSSHTPIPYTAWRLCLFESGLIKCSKYTH